MSEEERCVCGHLKKNHASIHLGEVIRRYLNCRYCDCERFKLMKRED